MYDATAGYPDLAAIRAWTRVPATVVDDDELGHVAGAEQAAQRAILLPPATAGELDDAVYQAFLRRVARHLAAKNIPLGFVGPDAEFGVARLSRLDAEISRLEAPHVEPVLA